MKACNRQGPISGLQLDYVHDCQKENKMSLRKRMEKKKLENNDV